MSNPAVKSGITLSDRLSIVAILVGVLGVVVAGYFGYLTINPPPAPTATPGPTPTAVPSGTVFFEDDFEHGAGKWSMNQAWEIREDGSGDHFLCGEPKGQALSFAFPKVTGSWSNYVFSTQVMLADALKQQGAFAVDAHFNSRPEITGYNFQVTDGYINLMRFDPEARKYQAVTSYEGPTLEPDRWYAFEIQTKADGTVSFSVDGQKFVEFVATTDLIPEGSIRVGAGPTTNVCFDDVKVSVPE